LRPRHENTDFLLAFSMPLTKHCSALSRSAVSRNDNRYRLRISSVRIFQQSVPVAYVAALSSKICTGSSIFHLFLS
jgi:hypothetical protein